MKIYVINKPLNGMVWYLWDGELPTSGIT